MTVIEVFADVACPFTHVGLLRFVERRARSGRSDVRLRVRAWPLEIVNGHPLDPHFIAEEVVDIRSELGLQYFTGFREEAFPSTSMRAFALTAAAYERGVETGEAVALQLRRLLFEDGVDIADPEVLESVAAEHGLDCRPDRTDAVLVDHAEGAERGVTGSPHFFTPTGDFFCPSLEVGRDDAGKLHVAFDPAGFDRFLASCFS